MPLATEEQHSAAVIAAYNTAGAHAYDYNDLPAKPPDFYTLVHVMQMYGGIARGSGERDTTDLYRVTSVQVAKDFDNARLLRTKARSVEGSMLTIAGGTTTPLTFETAEVIGPDDGWYSGRVQQTYAL